MDKSGNLYGVTPEGGSTNCNGGCGVLYTLSKKGTFTVLHSFKGGTSDGCYPLGSVVQDKVGNLYGTTNSCGSKSCGLVGCGTIWKVSKTRKETVLYNFASPLGSVAGVTRDAKGNLYGVTVGGGANNDGTLYELSATGKLTVLHSFDWSDGLNPLGEVLRTTTGTLYGTTVYGGTGNCGEYSCGTVWSYVP